MTIPAWPKINYLANQGTGNASLSDGKGRVTTEMDNGASRSRRRFTQVISPRSATIRLSYDELAIFEYFYKEVIKDGSMWFYMPIQRGNSYIINLVMFDPQSNPSTTEAGFNVVDLSISLLVRNPNGISKEVFDYFATFGYQDGQGLSFAIDHFVNVSYPRTGEF